ncbi:MAG: ATP synthase F0 subunit C [Candidatus Hydrogenedentota bacterium]
MDQLMAGNGMALFGLGIGAGITVLGAAKGIGQLAASALEATGRQPEAAGSIQTQMIIAAGLIEGFTFFALAAIWFGLAAKIGG